MKNKIKQFIQLFPFIWPVYLRVKLKVKHIFKLHFYFYDIYNTFKNMYWPINSEYAISSQLLFQYHKLEKGLVMPGKKRFFGIEPANKILILLDKWQDKNMATNDPIYIGAIETLHSYKDILISLNLDPENSIVPKLNLFLSSIQVRDKAYITPQQIPELNRTHFTFHELMLHRRSVRNYRPDFISKDIIRDVIKTAQLSPSACNRQPWKITIINNSDVQKKILSLQNGNRGFGHLAPHIAVITADESCFFDASERHEPFIDTGLFTMSFILALSEKGIGSCCLNWCVSPAIDKKAKVVLKLNDSLRIIMLVTIGYPAEDCHVPLSSRRATSDILTFI